MKNYRASALAAKAATDTAHKTGTDDDHAIAAARHELAAGHADRLQMPVHKDIHEMMAAHHKGPDPKSEQAAGYDDAIEACHESPVAWSKAKGLADKGGYGGDSKFAVAQTIYKNMEGDDAMPDSNLGIVQGRAALVLAEINARFNFKRMEAKTELQAGITGAGYSFNDLQKELGEKVSAIVSLTTPATKSSSLCSSGPWVSDVICPAHEAGETWSCIVQAVDGKLYEVKFTLDADGDGVTISGEPKQVERETDYEYIVDEEAETEARSALQAARADNGKFSGDALDHSVEAFKLRKTALASGSKDDHEKAKGMFLKASDMLKDAGKKRLSEIHAELADEHDKAMKACEAKDKPVEGELQAHAELDCAADQTENGLRTVIGADVPEVVMYFPGGVHTISPSQITASGRKPVTVSVLVDEHTADSMEEQRQALEAAGKKPFFSLEHESEKAAFWPSEFFWDKRVDANGDLVAGVWARGEWTKSGREAVEGKDYRTFSPSFFVEAVRNDPSKPVKVVCNVNARANMGALENDPAFKKISALWARNARGGTAKVAMPSTVEAEMRQMVRHVHDTLAVSINPGLADIQEMLLARYDIRLSEGEIGRYLTV